MIVSEEVPCVVHMMNFTLFILRSSYSWGIYGFAEMRGILVDDRQEQSYWGID